MKKLLGLVVGKRFSLFLILVILGLAITLFSLIPLHILAYPYFWNIFYERYNTRSAVVVARTLSYMGPPIAVCGVFSYLFGSISASIVGQIYTRRTISFCFMYGLYGVAIGYITGASKQSVATEALASIISVVAALFGYLISKDLSQELKAMVPPGLICFILSFMFSTHYYAIYLSTNLGLSR